MNSLYQNYTNDFSERIDIILLANKYDKILRENNNQTGGKLHIIEFDGYKFKIDISKNEDLIMIELQQSDGNPPSCITVLINSDGICALHGIGVYEKCVAPTYTGGKMGSLLLKFIIRFLQINRDKLNIKRIELMDNSVKSCPNCPERVKLSNMMTILYGDTWYGRYGFRPIEIDHIGDTQSYNTKYENNKKIIKTIKVKDIPLLDIIIRSGERAKITINQKNLSELLDKNKEKLVSDFMIDLLKKYDQHCCLFENMSDELFRVLGLHSFYKYKFYMDL